MFKSLLALTSRLYFEKKKHRAMKRKKYFLCSRLSIIEYGGKVDVMYTFSIYSIYTHWNEML